MCFYEWFYSNYSIIDDRGKISGTEVVYNTKTLKYAQNLKIINLQMNINIII